MNKLRIVFMGTPEFASYILNAIVNQGYHVAAVITAPDKPAGRGQKIKYSSVKEYAVSKGLKILQPVNLKDQEFLAALKQVNANLNIVVAFRMLPRAVWEMPEYGTFNLHASLLPDYRGAAPINWAIVNGEKKTGVTTFFIDDKIDTGQMILRKEIDIEPDENAGSLHDRLMELGGKTVIETLKQIENNEFHLQTQAENAQLKTAPKLTRENCRIDWRRSAVDVHNLVRGLSPYPAAWFTLRNAGEEFSVKIFQSQVIENLEINQPGTIIQSKETLYIACADGWISVLSLQFPGKSRMTLREFANGYRFSEDVFAL